MTTKELANVKKALKKDVQNAETYLLLAKLGVEVGATESPEQCGEARRTIVTELTQLKQSISANVEKLMSEIDSAINQMS